MENGRENLNSVGFCIMIALFFYSENSLTLGRTTKVFLSFFLEDKTSARDVFSSCLFILWAHFETSLVMVSCYGYEI